MDAGLLADADAGHAGRAEVIKAVVDLSVAIVVEAIADLLDPLSGGLVADDAVAVGIADANAVALATSGADAA